MTRAEDLTQGKITLPVAKAFSRLDLEDRRWLWDTIRSCPTDTETLQSAVEMIDSVSALADSLSQAHDLTERAWAQLDPLVEDTSAKIMLRALSWYVLERHY